MGNEEQQRRAVHEKAKAIVAIIREHAPSIRDNYEDAADLIMSALEKYSIASEGGSEGGLRTLTHVLDSRFKERRRAM